MALQELWVCHLGTVEYRRAVALQEQLRARRLADEVPDVLLCLEHAPVYTRGRRTEPGELPMGEDFYRSQGIDVVDTERGGKVTYHGPGQLVGYPVMRTGGVRAFVATMEAAIVAALADERIDAGPRAGLTGVWVGERKIASIGVHISRRVSTHGFAVNVENDLEPFSWIVPCGLTGAMMTSIVQEQRARPESVPTHPAAAMRCFRRRMAYRFCEAHGRRQRLVSPARIGLELGQDALVAV
jgi:lipoyl(octanoyl) transferase